MDAMASFHRIISDLHGARISHVWLGYGSALFLECGVLTERVREDGSTANPQGQWSVGLEFDWRIDDYRGLTLGSDDDGSSGDTVRQALVGQHISKVEAVGSVPELHITLSNGTRLLTFSPDGAEPEWALTDRRHEPQMWVYWSNGTLQADDGERSGP